MIEKPAIIITSAARTGTVFFARLFRDNFPDVVSLHEPENVSLRTIFKVANEFGLFNSVIKKSLGRWGITNLSNRRMAGNISEAEAACELVRQRERIIGKYSQRLYVESSYHFYGLLDILPQVFERHKAIFIVRDPRDWVVSHMNVKRMYYWRDLLSLLRMRLSPFMVGDTDYMRRWNKMGRFERLCWAWNCINSYALESIKKNPDGKVYSFEELFVREDRYETWLQLVEFVTCFDDVIIEQPAGFPGKLAQALNTKVNKPSAYWFPGWRQWDRRQAAYLKRVCGPLMERLGYGGESEWKALTDGSEA